MSKTKFERNWVLFTEEPKHSILMTVNGGFSEAFEVLMDHFFVHFLLPKIQFEVELFKQKGYNLANSLEYMMYVTNQLRNELPKNHIERHSFFANCANHDVYLLLDGKKQVDIVYQSTMDKKDNCNCFELNHAKCLSIVRKHPITKEPNSYQEPYKVTMRLVLNLKKTQPVYIPFSNEVLEHIRSFCDTEAHVALNTAFELTPRNMCHYCNTSSCKSFIQLNVGPVCSSCLKNHFLKENQPKPIVFCLLDKSNDD